ncbi:hypothetical protein GCM10029976_085700 [Kribbella albertanoniae]|uniref:Uncharacterized protein n=1 Tax=Kribbella albertanoniae TaxID=1266829 RepID=A0A4R4PGX4_9ACTN|nr:hypothetical protein [Kribbella albertanoniae]TDC21049.1 hypothetical protein E1261_34225 [Kribbella albertanoniae]
MNDDNWTTLQSAGKVPPPSPEVLAHATQRVAKVAAGSTRRRTVRRFLAPVLATAATAAVIGVVALQQGGTPTALPVAPATTPTTYPPSKPLGDPNVSHSCAYPLSPERFAKVPVAFDGTVLSAVKIPETQDAGLTTWNVTFVVNEWFRPSSGKQQFTVQMGIGPGHQVQTSVTHGYEIGDRLLISGAPRTEGGDPMDRPWAGVCDFSRTYDVPTADTWRKILSK